MQQKGVNLFAGSIAKDTTRNAWTFIGIAWLFYLYEYVLRVTPSIITHDLMREFSVTASSLGVLSSMYYLAYVPLQFPCGIIIDRYGVRVVITFSALLCALGAFAFSQSDTLGFSQFGRFLLGAGSACAYVCCGKVASEWFSPNRFAMIMGFTMMMGTFGGVFGGKPYSILVAHVGWRSSFAYAAVLGLIIALLAWLLIRSRGEPISDSSQEDVPKQPFFLGFKTVIKNPKQWLVGLYACMMYLPLSAFAELWGVPYLMQSYGISSATASIGTTMVFLGIAVGSAVSPFLSQLINSRLTIMKWASVLTLIFFAAVFYIPNLSLHTTFSLLFLGGVANGGQILYLAVALEMSCNKNSGTTLGFANGLTMASGLIFQPLLGLLIDYSWSGKYNAHGAPDYVVTDYKFAFTYVLIAIIIARLLLNFLGDTSQKKRPAHRIN